MAAQNEIAPPEWAVPGAEVVAWDHLRGYGSGQVSARVDTIKSVGKMWITLDNTEHKIRIRDLSSPKIGSSYAGYYIKIINRDSDEGARLLNQTHVDNAAYQAQRVADAFAKKPRDAKLRAAMRDALDCLDDALKLLEGNGS